LDQEYTYNNKTWRYNGTGWIVKPATNAFQVPLVSGTNIKTVVGNSLLGSGNLTLTNLGATTVGSNLFGFTNPSAISFFKINADNTVVAESAATYRGSLGGTTVGSNLFTLANPTAIRYLKINADNTVSTRTAAEMLTDLGAQATLVNQTNIKSVDNTTLLGSGNLAIPFEICYTVTGALTVGAGTIRWYCRENLTIQNVYVQVSTAPTGASIIVDVNKNAAGTIFTTQGNRPTIAASAFTDTSSVPDITSMTAGDYFLIDIDQIGSTVAGSNLCVRIVAIKA